MRALCPPTPALYCTSAMTHRPTRPSRTPPLRTAVDCEPGAPAGDEALILPKEENVFNDFDHDFVSQDEGWEGHGDGPENNGGLFASVAEIPKERV